MRFNPLHVVRKHMFLRTQPISSPQQVLDIEILTSKKHLTAILRATQKLGALGGRRRNWGYWATGEHLLKRPCNLNEEVLFLFQEMPFGCFDLVKSGPRSVVPPGLGCFLCPGHSFEQTAFKEPDCLYSTKTLDLSLIPLT